MRATCLWCGGELRFTPADGGWVHASTGTWVVTYVDPLDRARDDHGALPVAQDYFTGP